MVCDSDEHTTGEHCSICGVLAGSTWIWCQSRYVCNLHIIFVTCISNVSIR